MRSLSIYKKLKPFVEECMAVVDNNNEAYILLEDESVCNRLLKLLHEEGIDDVKYRQIDEYKYEIGPLDISDFKSIQGLIGDINTIDDRVYDSFSTDDLKNSIKKYIIYHVLS